MRQAISRMFLTAALAIGTAGAAQAAKRLHATTVGGFFTDTKAVADWLGPHQRLLVARDSFPDALQLPPEQW